MKCRISRGIFDAERMATSRRRRYASDVRFCAFGALFVLEAEHETRLWKLAWIDQKNLDRAVDRLIKSTGFVT